MAEQIKFLNETTIEGEVYNSDIELKEYTDKEGNTKKALAGIISIKTGENEIHKVKYMVNELKKDGGVNGIFTNVKTVVDELITLEEIAQGKAPEGSVATKVRVRGEVDLNEYFREGQLTSNVQAKGVFLNRVKDESQFDPKATYDVEGVVISVTDEIKKGEETGRKVVKLLIPTYNSAIPVSFVTTVDDADYIDSYFEVGSTVNLYGNIINYSEATVVEQESGFGKGKTKTTYNQVRENLITGGNLYDEDNPKSLTDEQIKELQVKRNTHLATLQEKAEQKADSPAPQKKAGFGGAPETKKTSAPRIIGDVF